MPRDRHHPDLGELAALVGGAVTGDGTAVPGDVRHDSSAVVPGDLFVAIAGFRVDGHGHAAQAVANGAVALCVQHHVDVDVPQIVVADTRAALPILAAAVHDHPARSLFVIGVTGTNGKTTVTHMIESMVDAAGRRSAVVGTVGARIAGEAVPVGRTTPESTDLQRLLRAMVDAGVDVAALEVSSHALVLGRVDGIVFDVAAFTNLSQDHLDFHGSMEEYFAAKAVLFTPERSKRAVVWIDDPAGRRIAAAGAVPTTTVGFGEGAEVTAGDPTATIAGSRFTLQMAGTSTPIELRLAAKFNVANALVAAACAAAAGVGTDAIAAGLGALETVPGRFEVVDAGQDFSIVVDYAHTPVAVAAVIDQARRLVGGRIIVVLGAGGDRDRAKRPAMGAAAAAADVVIFTSDNPRSEDPDAIIAALLAGAGEAHRAISTEPERRRAIERAVAEASAGDVVLVLGKGHEQGQEFADHVAPFDDRVVAAEALAAAALRREVTR